MAETDGVESYRRAENIRMAEKMEEIDRLLNRFGMQLTGYRPGLTISVLDEATKEGMRKSYGVEWMHMPYWDIFKPLLEELLTYREKDRRYSDTGVGFSIHEARRLMEENNAIPAKDLTEGAELFAEFSNSLGDKGV